MNEKLNAIKMRLDKAEKERERRLEERKVLCYFCGNIYSDETFKMPEGDGYR